MLRIQNHIFSCITAFSIIKKGADILANVHYLKLSKPFFQDVKSGIRQFEVRINDRDYQVGDTLILDEIDQNTEKHTGDWAAKLVVCKLDDTRFVKEGFVILGLQDIKI